MPKKKEKKAIDQERVIYLGDKIERIEIQDHDKDENIKLVLLYNAGEFMEYDIKSDKIYRLYVTEEDLEAVKKENEKIMDHKLKKKATPSKRVEFEIFYGDANDPKPVNPVIRKYIEMQK